MYLIIIQSLNLIRIYQEIQLSVALLNSAVTMKHRHCRWKWCDWSAVQQVLKLHKVLRLWHLQWEKHFEMSHFWQSQLDSWLQPARLIAGITLITTQNFFYASQTHLSLINSPCFWHCAAGSCCLYLKFPCLKSTWLSDLSLCITNSTGQTYKHKGFVYL